MVQPEAFEACLPVIEAFEAIGADYLVGGSIASSFHGTPRSTFDVDLVADLRMAHGYLLAQRLGEDFYADLEQIQAAILKKTSFNLIHRSTMFKVDVFVLKNEPFAKEEMRRRQRIDLPSGSTIEVASAEDTLLQKLIWYRIGNEVSDRQWQDILGIVRVQAGRLDESYLESWAERLDLVALLQRALAT